MSTVREIMLQRAKQTAKLQPMDFSEGGCGGAIMDTFSAHDQPAPSQTGPALTRAGAPAPQSTRTRPARLRGMPGPLAAGEDQMSEVPPSSDVRGSGRTNHVNMNNYPRASARSSAVGGEKKMHAPGSIPKYLQKFKQAKEDEKAKKEADAKKIKVPEGYRLVEEDERLATMEWFSEELACLGKEMQKLPIRIETLAQKKREKDLLERKTRLEDGVKMFSKKLVFLPADSEPLCGDFSANCNYNCNDDEESTTVEDLAPAVPDTNDRLFGGYEEEPVPRDAENSNYARHFTRNADLLSHDNVSGHRPISPSDPNFEYPAHHPPGARGPAAVHRLPGRSGAEDGGNFLNGYNYKEPAAVYQEPGMGFEAEAGATDITHPSSQSGAHYMDIERNGEPVSGAGYSFYGGGGAGSQQDSYRSSDPIVNKPAMVFPDDVAGERIGRGMMGAPAGITSSRLAEDRSNAPAPGPAYAASEVGSEVSGVRVPPGGFSSLVLY
mmetsp:Transcript_14018/g.34699  ORF Transcript_14018/g.34699 Transcript_14018/m.34699 type:complete len:494 (-) Transcript_14018:393-1874(-)